MNLLKNLCPAIFDSFEGNFYTCTLEKNRDLTLAATGR